MLTILDFIGYICRLALSGIMVCATSLMTSLLLNTCGSMPPLILVLQAIIIIFFSYRKYLPSFIPSVKPKFSCVLWASMSLFPDLYLPQPSARGIASKGLLSFVFTSLPASPQHRPNTCFSSARPSISTSPCFTYT